MKPSGKTAIVAGVSMLSALVLAITKLSLVDIPYHELIIIGFIVVGVFNLIVSLWLERKETLSPRK